MIPPRQWLNDRGACLTCGVTWPPLDECHVCHGPAETGEYWRSLHVANMPEKPGCAPGLSLPDLVGHAVSIGEITTGENGLPKRKGINRLLRKLGHKTPYYRWAWRSFLTDWFSQTRLGRDVAYDERMRPKGKGNA